ncbi:MAG: chemotaxis protein CheW [Brachymonas sp.]|nr:chemotaxis protein CheW [Brachymonas sp.]
MNEKYLPSALPALLDALPSNTANAADAPNASNASNAPADAVQSASPAPAGSSLLGAASAEMQGKASASLTEPGSAEETAPVADDAAAAMQEDDALFAPSAPTAAARMVSYARGKHVAFAPHATQELIENPRCLPVPGGAYYAHGLLHWQNRHIPFIDLESLLQAYPAFDPQAPVPYALVLAYQTAPQQPLQYGAIAMTDIPSSQTVSDADFSPLPGDSDMWVELAISCFKQNGQVTPILDAAKIFSRYHG